MSGASDIFVVDSLCSWALEDLHVLPTSAKSVLCRPTFANQLPLDEASLAFHGVPRQKSHELERYLYLSCPSYQTSFSSVTGRDEHFLLSQLDH